MFRVIVSEDDICKLQNDSCGLCHWSKEWLMLFNIDKCKVMHVGHGNVKATYSMNGIVLNEVVNERDLGVIVENNLKCSKQCAKVVTTANRVIGMIRRSFSYLSQDITNQFNKSLVRPHLEYCVQVWRPYLRKDIDNIEKIQRRITKMVFGLEKLSYEERLKKVETKFNNFRN